MTTMTITISHSDDAGAWRGSYPTVRDARGYALQVLWDAEVGAYDDAIVIRAERDDYGTGQGQPFGSVRRVIAARVSRIRADTEARRRNRRR